MVKEQRLSSIVTAGIEVFIIITIMFGVGVPLSRYTNRIKTELENTKSELKEAEELIRMVPNPQVEITKIKKAMDDLKDRGVSEQELPKIIQQLVNKSSELEIEIISIKPHEAKGQEDKLLPRGVSKAYVEMIIKCPFSVLGEYLQALKDLSVLFTIENLYIEKIEEIASMSGKNAALTAKRKPGQVQDLYTTLTLSTYTIWKMEI